MKLIFWRKTIEINVKVTTVSKTYKLSCPLKKFGHELL